MYIFIYNVDSLIKRLSGNGVLGNGLPTFFASALGTGLSTDNDDEFTTGLGLLEVCLHFGKGAANTLLMAFRYFAAGTAGSVGSEHFGHLVQGPGHAMRAFVENHGALLIL